MGGCARSDYLGLQSIPPLQKWNSPKKVHQQLKCTKYFITYYGEDVYEWFGVTVIMFYDKRPFFKSPCWSCVCLLSLVEGPPCDEKSSIVKDNWSKNFYVLTRQRMKGCHQNSRNPAYGGPITQLPFFHNRQTKIYSESLQMLT